MNISREFLVKLPYQTFLDNQNHLYECAACCDIMIPCIFSGISPIAGDVDNIINSCKQHGFVSQDGTAASIQGILSETCIFLGLKLKNFKIFYDGPLIIPTPPEASISKVQFRDQWGSHHKLGIINPDGSFVMVYDPWPTTQTFEMQAVKHFYIEMGEI